MEPLVVGAVLLSALLHASWNAFVKVGGDRWLVPGVIMVAAGLFGAIGAIILPMPQLHHWPWLIASGILHATYLATLALAFSVGDYGRVYPIARGTAPLLIFAASVPILGQEISLAMTACIAAIALGLISLAWQPNMLKGESKKAVPYALATGFMIAAYSIVDAAGIRRIGADLQPAMPTYLSWIMIIASIVFTSIVVVKRHSQLIPFVRANAAKGSASAVVVMASYGLVIWAFSQAPAAPVAALRETSVVFGALIATFILGESFGRRRIPAALIVAAGAGGLQLVG